MSLKISTCQHLREFKPTPSESYACKECLKTESSWVHLRTCQTCGVTLCCDSSPNQHATAHFNGTGHPVVISAEPGENWAYCYLDKKIAKT